MAFNPSARQLSLIKAAVFVAALLPFLWAAWQVVGGVPVDPLEYITHESGDWALYLLCITLAVTPLRRLSGWNWLVKLRRMLGLFAFFYALLHFWWMKAAKNNLAQPTLFAVIVAVLLGLRVVWSRAKARAAVRA